MKMSALKMSRIPGSKLLSTAAALIALSLLSTAFAFGQAAELQQKLASVKQAMKANQQKLHQYQWTETQQLTLKGDQKPPKQSMCQYGPNGQVVKTPMGAPQQAQQDSGRRGRLKEHVVEKKTEEMQDYMGQVKGLLSLYVPPSGQKMQAAYAAGNASINPSNGAVNLIFKNYAQQGDTMTLTFDPQAKKITHVDVDTWMDKPGDTVTLQLNFASLPDGTNYVQQSVLNASAKQLVVTTTNSNYQKMGQ